MRNKTFQKIEILLVEDNVGDLLLMMKFLKETSVKNHVNVARDGKTALDYLRRLNGFENTVRPDLILLDLNLPGMDGREVLTEIKEDPTLSSIPVIILTSSDSPEDIMNAYKSKADYYMTKPQNLNQFTASTRYLEEAWLQTLTQLKESSQSGMD